jgi:riboflavin synthase
VSGACLTVASLAAGAFEADVTNQTLSVTKLGQLEPGHRVNLEPALRAGEPLGGHLVQGHVDGTGTVSAASEDGFMRRVGITVPEELRRYLVEHGSVAVDGVSLTVAGLVDEGLETALIPETLSRTTLGELGPGDAVNLEMDLIARHMERLVQGFEGRERKEDG